MITHNPTQHQHQQQKGIASNQFTEIIIQPVSSLRQKLHKMYDKRTQRALTSDQTCFPIVADALESGATVFSTCLHLPERQFVWQTSQWLIDLRLTPAAEQDKGSSWSIHSHLKTLQD